MNNKVILIFLGALGYYYYLVTRAAKNITIRAGKILKVSLASGLVVDFQAVVLNPTNQALFINSLAANPIFEGKIFGAVYLLENTAVQGKSETPLNLRLVIPYTDFLLLPAAIKNGLIDKQFDFRIVGVARAFGITIPVNETFKIIA